MSELALYGLEDGQQCRVYGLGFNLTPLHSNGVFATAQIHRCHGNLCLADSPTSVKRYLELHCHPIEPATTSGGISAGSEFMPNDFYVSIREFPALPALGHAFDTQVNAGIGHSEVAPDSLAHNQPQGAKVVTGRVLTYCRNLFTTGAPRYVFLTERVSNLARMLNVAGIEEQRQHVPAVEVTATSQRVRGVLGQELNNPLAESRIARQHLGLLFLGGTLVQYPVRRAFPFSGVVSALRRFTAKLSGGISKLDIKERAARTFQQSSHNRSGRLWHGAAAQVKFIQGNKG